MRKHFPVFIKVILLCVTFFILGAVMEKETGDNPVTSEVVKNAEKLIGLNFSDAKQDSMLNDLNDLRTNYENLRKVPLPNSVPPALVFDPFPAGFVRETERRPVK